MAHKLKIDIDDSIMEQYAKDLAHQIQQEIDFQIIADMLVQMGWTRLTFNPHQDEKTSADIRFWLEHHCKGNCKSLNDVWLFEHEKDAMWFMLRWGDKADTSWS